MTVTTNSTTTRCWLWIDGVGGYLVCLNETLVIGQAVAGNEVDIPLWADISRRQACIQRHESNYLLIAERGVRVAGQPVEGRTWLPTPVEIALGAGVRLGFGRPHPYSQTARLDFHSNHRPQPSADAVLLMAETCVLGPEPTSHVVCPHWPSDVLLVRRGGELWVQSKMLLSVDGGVPTTRSRLGPMSRVSGTGVAFGLETR